MPKKKPFEGKKLHKKIKGRFDYLESKKGKINRSIGVGVGVSAAFDPILGIPLAVPGVVGMIKDASTRGAIRKRLLKKPRAARLMAKKFQGTEHNQFFAEIVKKIEKEKKKREKQAR